MTIYRYDMTIPVRVVSALHSGGADEVPERPITDEDDRTVQPNAFVRNGLGEAILPGRSIKGAIRAAFEEHMNELGFSEEELKSLWGGEMRREVGTPREQRGIGTEEPLPLRASALHLPPRRGVGPQQGRAPPPDEHGHRPRHWWGSRRGAFRIRVPACGHDLRDPCQCRGPGTGPRHQKGRGSAVHNTECRNKGDTACVPCSR